jgi:hypothetical protein
VKAIWQVHFDQALSKWLLIDFPSRDQLQAIWEWVLGCIEWGVPEPSFQSPGKESEWLSPIDPADMDAIFMVYRDQHIIIVTDFLPQREDDTSTDDPLFG